MLNYFFKKVNWIKIVLFIIAVILGVFIVIFYKTEPANYILTSFFIAILFLWFLSMINLFGGKLSPEEFDFLCQNDYEIAYSRVFNDLAISTRNSEYIAYPIEIITPTLFPGKDAIVYRYHKKAKIIKYSHNRIEWLLFGHKTLYYFQTNINHLTGECGFDRALEIAYKDIITIETISDLTSSERIGFKQEVDSLLLRFTFINNNNLDITLRSNPILSEKITPMPLSNLETQLVYHIRQTIRKQKESII